MDKTTKKTPESNLFPEIFSMSSLPDRKVEVNFCAPDLSSQGGLILMCEFEQRTEKMKVGVHTFYDSSIIVLKISNAHIDSTPKFSSWIVAFWESMNNSGKKKEKKKNKSNTLLYMSNV